MPKRQCELGSSCPYQDPHRHVQHLMEFAHDNKSPKKPKFSGEGRKLGTGLRAPAGGATGAGRTTGAKSLQLEGTDRVRRPPAKRAAAAAALSRFESGGACGTALAPATGGGRGAGKRFHAAAASTGAAGSPQRPSKRGRESGKPAAAAPCDVVELDGDISGGGGEAQHGGRARGVGRSPARGDARRGQQSPRRTQQRHEERAAIPPPAAAAGEDDDSDDVIILDD